MMSGVGSGAALFLGVGLALLRRSRQCLAAGAVIVIKGVETMSGGQSRGVSRRSADTEPLYTKTTTGHQ